jgi:enamine deaminase RidA (YjgF/YER057c/UK114 family)
MAIERYAVNTYGPAKIRHAPLVRAGKWIFGTGLRAPRADSIFANLGRALVDAGGALSSVVRVDQYFPNRDAVGPYHVARKQAFGGSVPPSTSVLVGGLLEPGALVDVQAMATTLDSSLDARPVQVAGLVAPAASAYYPCTRVGDLVFVAGQLARDGTGVIAPEARGDIALETRYLVERRLRPALQAADSDLDLILKAQVYLSHAADLPAFWQVWSECCSGKVPPTLVVPLRHPAFLNEEATIEINVIAASAGAHTRIRDIECDIDLLAPGMVPARSFDGLLFVAGLMAIDSEGLVPQARTAGAQMADILAKARKIFAAAGCELENVVRVLQFHSDLGDFHDTYTEWRSVIGDAGLPFSAVEVGTELFVPGASVIVDLWGAA